MAPIPATNGTNLAPLNSQIGTFQAPNVSTHNGIITAQTINSSPIINSSHITNSSPISSVLPIANSSQIVNSSHVGNPSPIVTVSQIDNPSQIVNTNSSQNVNTQVANTPNQISISNIPSITNKVASSVPAVKSDVSTQTENTQCQCQKSLQKEFAFKQNLFLKISSILLYMLELSNSSQDTSIKRNFLFNELETPFEFSTDNKNTVTN